MIIDDNSNHTSSPPSDQIPTPSDVNIRNPKRKRRPAGTPDPDAEVVSLSPRTLLESDRYLCEICGQGFQREQNLQMHRRRHKVPWKLLKRPDNSGGPSGGAARKRVYVCPEETCLHHQAAHALGDLVGIKKHFRRKHSGFRQWMCAKCSKAYAVHSDFKAHLKTCGTRGHSCDCGRVFSRVESFIEHQDACNMGRTPAAVCLSPSDHSIRTTNENENNNNNNIHGNNSGIILKERHSHNLELQLLTATPAILDAQYHSSSRLHLSIGSSSDFNTHNNKDRSIAAIDDPVTPSQAAESEGEGIAQARLEKAYADEARREAKLDMQKAEREFANARRIRQHARAELDKAHALKDHTANRIRATLLEITCHACKQHIEAREREARQGTSSYSSPNAILGCQGDNRINQTQHVA